MCAGGPSTGALAPSAAASAEHTVQFTRKIVQERVQFAGPGNRSQHGQLAAALREHYAQPLARLEDPLDENYVFVSHKEMACRERGVEEFG
jgi:hypothetical protein